MFCAYVAAMWEAQTDSETSDGPEFQRDGYDPPDASALLDIPWTGDGPDPLEELFEAS